MPPSTQITPLPLIFPSKEFMLFEIRFLRKLAPLKKTEFANLYFGEGANPADLLLKPNGKLRDRNATLKGKEGKTIIEYLYDLPVHLNACREALAYNLLLHPQIDQRFILTPEEHQPGDALSKKGKQAIVGQLRTKPILFLKKVNAVNAEGIIHDDLKLDVRDSFSFDFDAAITRVWSFTKALKQRDVEGIKQGVQMFKDLKAVYLEVPKRLYAINGDDQALEQADIYYAPFAQVLGALSTKLQRDLKAFRDGRHEEIAR